ncbi:MAG: hypothetical protein R3F40_01575 [Candidatus Competibacteraceae bacterium]
MRPPDRLFLGQSGTLRGNFTPFGFALADTVIELGAFHGGLTALLDGHLGTAERDRQASSSLNAGKPHFRKARSSV